MKNLNAILSLKFTSDMAGVSKDMQNILKKNLDEGKPFVKYRGSTIRMVYYKNEHLILGCYDEELLNNIIPLGDDVMKCGRVAEYMADIPGFDQLLHTAEWSINPTECRSELMQRDNVTNLRLFDDAEINKIEGTARKKMQRVA